MTADDWSHIILVLISLTSILLWTKERTRRQQVEQEYDDLLTRHRVWRSDG